MKPLLAIFLAITVANFGYAQRNPTGNTARVMLLMDSGIKKELKLTKDQDKAIQTMMTNGAKEMEKQLPAGFDLTNPMAHFDPKLEEILNSEQMQRIDGIFMQANSGFSLADARIAKMVNLSESQIAEVTAATKADQRAMMDSLTGRVSSGSIKDMAKKRLEAGQNLLKILDEAQTKIFNEALGKPIKFK